MTWPSEASQRAVDAALASAGLSQLRFGIGYAPDRAAVRKQRFPSSRPTAYIPASHVPSKTSHRSRKSRPSPRTGARGSIMSSTRSMRPGIALTGTEVKSLRFGEGSIAESYAEVKDDEVWLVNSNIPEFSHGNRFNHEPKRPRKLLLHEREINKLHGAVAREGMTLVPLSIYFNARAAPRSSWRWPRARRRMTSARRSRSGTGSASRARLMRDRG